MTSRYDMAALRKAAGETVFGRGETYHRQGKVRIAAIDGDRVLARVEGNETYKVELEGRHRAVGGRCSCPAFESSPFCKHMVAVALAADGLGPESEPAGTVARIRAHLKARGVDALVDMILGLAERDTSFFKKLDLAATPADADDDALETRLADALDQATDVGEFVGYEGAASWAERVDHLLEMVAEFVDSRPAVALRLVERALDGINEAFESIDDEEGEGITLLERAQKIHLAATSNVRPDPVALAHDLYARERGDDYGIFADAATTYADVLGDAGLATYRALAEADWAKLPSRTASKGNYTYVPGYNELMRILDGFAARDNNVAARIALRTKDLSTAAAYLVLVAFCRSHGHEADALRWAEEGLWMFEDARQDERLVLETVDLLVRAGRTGDATAHLWSAFRKNPGLNLYAKVREVCGEGARDEAIGILRTRLDGKLPNAFRLPADLLVRVLIREKMLDAAWATIREHKVSPYLKVELADASETTHAAEALGVYADRVEELIQDTRYADAVDVITRMAGLRSPQDQSRYLAALKERHRRKRNLMKLLG